MIDLHYFVHYFEVFVGFNGALVGFDKTRKMVYSFFSWRTDKQVEFEAQNINAGLHKINVYMLIYEKLSEGDLKFDTAPPWKKAIFDVHMSDFTDKYKKCQQEAVQFIKDSEEHEREYVEKRIPPWLVFCLLYCIMLILLCGFTKTYNIIEQYSFIFLAYFNSIVLSVFLGNQIYNSFLKRRINNFIVRFNRDLRLGKKRNVHHAYYYVYRHIKRFVMVLIVSIGATFISAKFAAVYPRFFFHIHEFWILFETLIICFMPFSILIFCAIRWKNKHLNPVLVELKKECKKLRPIVKEGLEWVNHSNITS